MVLHYISALADCHYCYFLLELIQVLLVFNCDDADSIEGIFILMRTNSVDFAHAAFANFLEETILKSRLSGPEYYFLKPRFKLAG